MSGIIAGAAVIGGVSLYMGNKKANQAQDAADANNALTAKIAAENLAFQKEQQKKLDAQKDIYRAMEFVNPYENMENAYEDLTVNQQQAQFQTHIFLFIFFIIIFFKALYLVFQWANQLEQMQQLCKLKAIKLPLELRRLICLGSNQLLCTVWPVAQLAVEWQQQVIENSKRISI